MDNEKTIHNPQERHENRDPITGAPGAHPVGTGVGAAGGAAAGAAVGTALGGPIGAGVGIIAGAVIGGLAGKNAAEAVDPTIEDAYWRENYRNREYVIQDEPYETYRAAYRAGYEGYSRYPGRKFEDVEPDLQREYEQSAQPSDLKWEQARPATRDAWEKLDQPTAGSQTPRDPGCGCS
jgi:hypothetical protein